MSSNNAVQAVDLFAGAGGFSTGLALACEELGRDVDLVAINHWEQAIETHRANHPWADHYHSKVEGIHPPNVVDGKVDILVAGPECTHFSNARGGKPVSEQRRASPFHVLDWLSKLDVDSFLIENVKELQNWGPVEDGKPTRNGEIFDAWINSLHALGYSVDWTTLNAANFGDPTSRERLFVMGQKNNRASFPDPTHSKNGNKQGTKPWRTAEEIIDWSDLGGSIWTRDLDDPRKKPLVNNTMKRIAEGIRRHCADRFEPFADILEDTGRDEVRDLRENRVIPREYAHIAARTLEKPFLVSFGESRNPSEESMILGQHSNSTARDVEARPAPTVATSGNLQLATSTSYLLRQQSGGIPAPVDAPVPTVAKKGAIGLVTPGQALIMPKNYPYRGIHSNSLYPPENQPHHTVTGDPRSKLVTPFLALLYNNQTPRTRRVDRSLMTVPAPESPAGLSRPFLIDYHGNSNSRSIFNPLGAVETRDRFALCIPEYWPWAFDLRYRMLKPKELKRAQGFPDDYKITGNKSETKKQIGNAVPVHLAKSLVTEVLTASCPSLDTYAEQSIVADD